MDFNPLRYVGICRSVPASGDIAFDFYWDEHGFGVVFHIVLKIEDSHYVFVLYEQFNPAECYPSEDEDGA
jgi:hypothetical protein